MQLTVQDWMTELVVFVDPEISRYRGTANHAPPVYPQCDCE